VSFQSLILIAGLAGLVALSSSGSCQAQGYTITTVAGTGFRTGDATYNVGDGGPASNAYVTPAGLAVDSAGSLYIADAANSLVRKVTPDGTISSVAGDAANQNSGYAGDQGPATSALLNFPHGVAVDSAGDLYIADFGNARIRKVTPDGTITTVAGGGAPTVANLGDGGQATLAVLGRVEDVAVDSAGDIYIADPDNNRVRKVATDGTITTVAGCAIGGPSCNFLSTGDGSPATNVYLSAVSTIAVDSSGDLYIADSSHNRIREVTPDGVISTVAGSGAGSYQGDGAPAVSAGLYLPLGVAVDAAGDIYIADFGDQRIRMVTPDGTISTIAGNGTQGYSGDGGPATSAALDSPRKVAVGPTGAVYFTNQLVVRMLTPSTP
jgi:sugar lactone lactonase YvrE